MKITLMTMNMFLTGLFQYWVSQDMEEFQEYYEEMLDLTAECGYKAVDITGMEPQTFGLDYVKEQLAKRGLEASSLIFMDQYACQEEEKSEEIIANGKKAVDMVKKLGAKLLMLALMAHPGIENDSADAIHAALIRHLGPIAAYAKEQGIHLAVENTPDLRLCLCSAKDFSKVLDEIGQLEVVYDSGNTLLVKEDPIIWYETFADRTAHIHLKDMRLAAAGDSVQEIGMDGIGMTAAMTGTGLVNFNEVISHIKAHGYDGYLTIEFALDESGDYRKCLIESREYVEKLL